MTKTVPTPEAIHSNRKGVGFRSVCCFYDNSHAKESVKNASLRLKARVIWSIHRAGELFAGLEQPLP